jgi:hypothetical protein
METTNALHDTGDAWLAAVLGDRNSSGESGPQPARDSAGEVGLGNPSEPHHSAAGPVGAVLPDEPSAAPCGDTGDGGAVSGTNGPIEGARPLDQRGDVAGSGGEGRGLGSRTPCDPGGAVAHIGACIDWLEDPANAGDPRCQERQAVVLDMMDALEGWPQDTLQDRRTLLELAELNGAPPYPALGIRGGLESWRCFLASACSVEDLRACRRAWR